MTVHHLELRSAVAGELAELLGLLDDWLGGDDSTLLADSFQCFVGTAGYHLNDLRTDLARFEFLLGAEDSTQLFGLGR